MKAITIKNKKSLFQAIFGLLIIIGTFIANGLLCFISLNFDFSKILTSGYWAHFTLLTCSELAVMYGMYIIRKPKDLSSEVITDLQKYIDKKRDVVYETDNITNAEDWLREIYNYKEKLILLEVIIKNKHSKIVAKEPRENCAFYNLKKKRYDKNIELKEWYKQQLEYIKLDKERLKLMALNTANERLEELNKQLSGNDDYAMNTAKFKFRDVYWADLTSNIDNFSKKVITPFFNGNKEVARNFIKCAGYSVISSGILSILSYPNWNALTYETIIDMIMTFIVLSMFLVRGYMMSKNIILGTYRSTLEKRKSIYSALMKDLGISNVVIEEVEVSNE